MSAAVACAVVQEARRWLGTPYRHQCATRGAGADCLGLVLGIWRAVQGDWPEDVPPYTPDWSEPSRQERLWQAAARHLVELPAGTPHAPGQVLLFRMRAGAVAKHLGVVSAIAPGRFIHAYSGHGVCESALTPPWARRVVARFAFPAGPPGGSDQTGER